MEKNTDIQNLLKLYDGKLITKDRLTDFDKSAMEFFHDRNYVDNPHIQVTVQFDISDAENVYRKKFASLSSSFLMHFQ